MEAGQGRLLGGIHLGPVEKMETGMPLNLNRLYNAIAADPGLRASISTAQINRGLAAATDLNTVLLDMIRMTGVNADGRISAADMQRISDFLWEDGQALDWRNFWLAHGNDNGDVVSGFHWVQNDGGTLMFRGRNFVDTVADAIYHYGFRIENGRYFNEDGNDNERIADVAGWLNYFLNGENIIYGNYNDNELHSGTYSDYFAAARNETFLAGAGNDRIWADLGNDLVRAGPGNDVSGGGRGNDRLYGDGGNDTLWGEQGNDSLYGGDGVDVLGGSVGDDLLDGGAGADRLMGEDGKDRLFGGAGNDNLSGGNGNDRLYGDAGNDTLIGGEGADHLTGGKGADLIQLWEQLAARDTLHFSFGDSGITAGTIDRVEGFVSGVDKIDLSDMGPMVFRALEFRGGGVASFFYDGQRLRFDQDGDGRTDMMVEFAWVETLRASDFILA